MKNRSAAPTTATLLAKRKTFAPIQTQLTPRQVLAGDLVAHVPRSTQVCPRARILRAHLIGCPMGPGLGLPPCVSPDLRQHEQPRSAQPKPLCAMPAAGLGGGLGCIRGAQHSLGQADEIINL